MTESEIWKDVVGYEGFYKVSNKGNVYSVERKNPAGIRCGGLILRLTQHKRGYIQVSLRRDGVMKTKKVHRLVAEAFIPNPNNYSEVNRRDEDKSNNVVENLEWCSRKYNMNYGTATKRTADKNNKPVKGTHKETGEQIYLKSMVEGALYGFDPKRISDVCLGKRQTHRGYSFEKIEEGEVVTFTSTTEDRNKIYADPKKSTKIKAVNIKTGDIITFDSLKEAVNEGYTKTNVSLACLGNYNRGGGNLYRGHRWSYE